MGESYKLMLAFFAFYPSAQTGSSTAASVSTSANMTHGNKGYVLIWWEGATPPVGVTDNSGSNVWNAVPNTLSQSAAPNQFASVQLFSCDITAPSGTYTITAAWGNPPTASFPIIMGLEFSGSSETVDQSAARAASSAPVTNPITTTQANEVLIAAFGTNYATLGTRSPLASPSVATCPKRMA